MYLGNFSKKIKLNLVSAKRHCDERTQRDDDRFYMVSNRGALRAFLQQEFYCQPSARLISVTAG